MNRCITCGKVVSKPKAQNAIERKGQTYLVCCPLCEKEFNRDPEHYVAVSQSVFGDNTVETHSQASARLPSNSNLSENHFDTARMTRRLKESFEAIERSYADLVKHFDQVSTSGGLEGMRNALREHREMMDSLQEGMAVHAGVCRFVLSVAESSTNLTGTASTGGPTC